MSVINYLVHRRSVRLCSMLLYIKHSEADGFISKRYGNNVTKLYVIRGLRHLSVDRYVIVITSIVGNGSAFYHA